MEEEKRSYEQNEPNCDYNRDADPYLKQGEVKFNLPVVLNILIEVFETEGDCKDHLKVLD